MKLRTLLEEEDAVSPVIGVILMVAITVILAAVIGTFVLGLGGQVQNTTPQASFTYDYEEGNSTVGTGVYNVTATHDGGDTLNKDNSARIAIASPVNETNFSLPVRSGDFQNVVAKPNTDVRVVWFSPSEDKSSTLARGKTPSG